MKVKSLKDFKRITKILEREPWLEFREFYSTHYGYKSKVYLNKLTGKRHIVEYEKK
ncbi:MAG: hypothetical protein QXN71_03550 [Candidatus Aenigmatarchaeota archaeon]